MAENKKSFILYCDIIHTIGHLTDEQAGRLFKHILEYVNDKDPETDDFVIKLAFEPIKQSLKRDLKRYDNIIERNRINGSKGGRPKKNPKNPVGYLETQENPKKPKKPDSDSDSVIDSDILLKKETKRYLEDEIEIEEEYDNIIIKKKEKEKLIEKYGFDGYRFMIHKLSNYKLSKGVKYKSDYGAINSWVTKEWEKEKSSAKKEKRDASEIILEKYGLKTNG